MSVSSLSSRTTIAPAGLFFQFVNERWMRPEESALLSEDDTAYGSVADAIVKSASIGTCASTTSANTSSKTQADCEATQQGQADVLHRWLSLRYPREIARLRNAVHDTPTTSEAKPPDSVVEGVKPTLREEASETSIPAKDNFPSFSKIQSPSSQQAALISISSALRREHVEYTGIIATDVLDSLFLTRFLRLSFPDTRVFALDSDLLFPRENETVPLQGVLCITTYPLLSRNQHWTVAQLSGSIPRRVTFASRSAQGIYNACRYSIQGDSHYDASKNGELLLEYARPINKTRSGSMAHRPALWLTVLGRQGYWPVALLDENETNKTPSDSSLLELKPEESTEAELKDTIHPESPSGGWYMWTTAVLLFACLHCVYVFHLLLKSHKREAPRILRGSLETLKYIFRSYPSSPITSYESPFLLIFTLALLCASYYLVQITGRFAISKIRTVAPQLYSFEIVTFILLFLTAVALLVQIIKDRQPPFRLYLWLVVPASLLATAFCITAYRLVNDNAYQQGYFFAYRSLNLTSGVSPTVPLLILELPFLFWAWKELAREKLSRARREALPVGPTDQNREKTEQYEHQVERKIQGILDSGLLRPAVIMTILWMVALRPWRTVRTFEWRLYDFLYWATLALVFYMLSVSFVHFRMCWSEFRSMLQMLERSPIRQAFSRLRKQITWVPLVAKLPDSQFLITTLSCETLSAIRSFQFSNLPEQDRWKEQSAGLDLDANKALALQDRCEAQISMSGEPNNVDYAKLQMRLGNIAFTLRDYLQKSTWSKGESESLRIEVDEKEAVPESKRLRIIEEEFIALRHLFFMRYVFRHLRNILTSVVATFIFIVLSLESYPFEGSRWIAFIFILTFITFGIGIGVVFAQMDRDAVLSRLTATKENELSKNFVVRMLQYGTLPLLTVLSTQFPWLHRAVSSIVQPALEVLH